MALAGVGLLSVVTRQPQRPSSQPLRRHPATDSGTLAALRDELHGVSPCSRPPTSAGDAAHGRDADTPSEIPARGLVGHRQADGEPDLRAPADDGGSRHHVLRHPGDLPGAGRSGLDLRAGRQPCRRLGSAQRTLWHRTGRWDGHPQPTNSSSLPPPAEASSGSGAIIGILVALWSANGGTKAIFDSLNVVYDEQEKRGYIRRTLVSLAVTLGTLVFVTLAVAAVVVLPIALNFVGLGRITDLLLRVGRWPLLLVIVTVMLAVIYRYGPSRTRRAGAG